MRILILGGEGMLGHQLVQSLSERHELFSTIRGNIQSSSLHRWLPADRLCGGVDVRSADALSEVFARARPLAVINAVGIVKQRDAARDAIESLEVNALLPHRLALMCETVGARLIQISTDCVFSGETGGYRESDFADARDLYGRSKYLGEVGAPHCVTLRSSIIGLELKHKSSLIEWFLAQRGTIRGFRKAIFSGLTTAEMARVIDRVLVDWTALSGLYQVASDPINKYDLLTRLAHNLGREDIRIEPDDSFSCDRSLNADAFNTATGYRPPAWDDMLAELSEQIQARTTCSSEG